MPAIFSSPVGRSSSIGVLAIIAMVLSVAFSVSFISAARPRGHALTKDYSYEHYVRDFNLAHGRDEKEHTFRRAIFEKRRDEAIAHNKQGHSWTMGINQFSDWTDEEVKKRLFNNGYKDAVRNRPFITPPSKIHTYEEGDEPLPYSIDWRTASPAVLGGVRDQGNCGSCFAQAATETMESHYAIATGDLHVLSVEQSLACAPVPPACKSGSGDNAGGCNGGDFPMVMDYVLKMSEGKVASEWTYPYISYSGNNVACKKNFSRGLFAAKFDGYTQVKPNDARATLSALKKGPLSISVAAGMNFVWYTGGVFTTANYTTLSHSVLLVGAGYSYSEQKHYWIVKNSWNPTWGVDGYIYMYRAPPNEPWKEPCYTDTADDNCNSSNVPKQICGESGLLFDVFYPHPVV